MLFETQQYVSSLVFNQVKPPNVWWSANMETLNCAGHILVLSDFRNGLQKAFEKLWQIYDQISGGARFASHLPENVRDDLLDDVRGYSFLSHGPYTHEPNAFLTYLIRHSPWKIATVDANDRLSWNIPAIKDFLRLTAEFNELLAILSFILPAISTRVTQFLDHKFRNDHRKRNLVAMLGETVLLTTYHKMTNQTGFDQWTPAFFPPKLREAMMEYLAGGLRDCETLLALQAYGPEAAALYARYAAPSSQPQSANTYTPIPSYLWVQNGSRPNDDRFCRAFKRFSVKFWGVEMAPQTWRHCAVSIAREFIPPHKRPSEGDATTDLASSHSTSIARGHYAVTDGDLPRLTADAIHEFRQIDEAWHSVCGVGPCPAPPPLRHMMTGRRTEVEGPPISRLKEELKLELVRELRGILSQELGDLKDTIISSMRTTVLESTTHIQHTPNLSEAPVDIPSSSSLPPLHSSQVPSPAMDMDADFVNGASIKSITGADFGDDADDELEYIDPIASPPQAPKRPSMEGGRQAADEHPSKRPRIDEGSPVILRQPSLLPGSDARQRALAAIRDVLGDRNAQPKTEEQLMIIARVLDGKEAYGVLPTGGGKSMVWQAVAKANPGAACAIICPFRFLLEDQLRSSEEKGFVAVRYTAGGQYPSDYQLMFLQPEHVKREGFKLSVSVSYSIHSPPTDKQCVIQVSKHSTRAAAQVLVY